MIRHIDIDPINRTLYLRFEEGQTAKTVEFMERRDVLIDLSKAGKLLGVEILNLEVPRKVLIAVANKFHRPALKKFHLEQAALLVA